MSYSFTVGGAQTERFQAPAGVWAGVRLYWKVNVTAGHGSTLNKRFEEGLQQMEIEATGLPKRQILDMRKDEMDTHCVMLADGVTQADTMFFNPNILFNTVGETTGFYDIMLNLDNANGKINPIVSITLDGSQWSAAADYQVDIKVAGIEGAAAFTEIVDRQALPSLSKHDIPLPNYPVDRILIVDGNPANGVAPTAGGLTSIRSPNWRYENPEVLVPEWNQHGETTQAAGTTGYYWITVDTNARPGEIMTIEGGSNERVVYLISTYVGATTTTGDV
jgi:hypothetical protein